MMNNTIEAEKHSIYTDEEDDPTQFQQQTILEEVFTSDYNVTEEEVLEYCRVVGIDAAQEPHLLPIAKAALLQPLPPPWTPVEDSRLGLYFFNRRTGESSWTHPVDALVRSLVARDRTRSSCTDSYTEDIFTEEDINISDLLKVRVSDDHSRSDCDVNNPSDYIPTALTSTKASPGNTEKSYKNRPGCCNPALVVSDSDFEEPGENSDNDINSDKDADSGSRGKENDTCVHEAVVSDTPYDDGNKTKRNNDVTEKEPENVKDCDDFANSDKVVLEKDNVDSVVSPDNLDKEPETKAETKDSVSKELSVCASSNETPPAQSVECVQDPNMFSGRDGGPPGRGLGRSPLDPPSLGTPPPLAGPPPLGRPVLGGGGGSAVAGARVPPLGGQLTPLAPIAAASRGGHAQLAPLKPVVSAAQQHPASRDGSSDPLLRRQPTQKEGQGFEDGSQKQQLLKGERVPGSGRQVNNVGSKGIGDSTEGLGSPPKSILKGPVLAHSQRERPSLQGVDRLLLTQPKETKNIRFDFKTDDLEFHSSEEEFDEEELEEEEEEEYDDEEEEEFDSEAEDPEEEAILRARGVIDDDSEGHSFMLNDASDLLSRGPALPPQKLKALPHGPDPWANEDSLTQIPKENNVYRDPLKDFRSQKEERKTVEKHIIGNALQASEVQTQNKKAPVQTGQAPVKDSQTTLKSVVHPKPDTMESQAGKPKPLTPIGSSTQSSVSPVKEKMNEASNKLQDTDREDVKKNETRPQEDRKLELEGAPKNRKTNPLDRVVAKLSGRTENKDVSQNTANTDTSKPAPKASGTLKNLTVNLTEIMNTEEGESEGEESPNVDDYSGPVNKTGQNDIHQKSLAATTQYEAEVEKLRNQHQSDLKVLREKLNKECQDMEERLKRVKEQQESDLKALREKLNKEYRNKEEEIRNEHKIAIQKFQEEERKKLEQTIKQIQSKLEEESKKDLENINALLQKENAEKKDKLMKETEKMNDEEIEKIKLGYVQDMQKKKEVMQREHEEEMQELEQELQALYSKQKNTTQEELDAAKAAVVSKSSKELVAETAVADMERSLAEVLRERQADIKREHNKQLDILQDELDKELEKAARQAKEKETSEKKNHAARVAMMKEEHEKEVRQLEESYEQNLNELEAHHEEDLHKLRSDFKAELTMQKTELENKLTELKIEYDQRMTHVENEDEMEVGEEDNEGRQKEEIMESDKKDNTPEERISHNENVKVENRRLNEEERKYDQILKELRERRRSLEEDLEELKTQENKVKELKNQKLTQSSPYCCSENVCIHESKYKKMKAKYSNLVNRIKSEKAKKSSKRLSATHEAVKISAQNSPSLSSDKSSLESNVNVSDSGQPSSDLTSSITSSPKHIRAQHTGNYHLKSTSDVSEDEEVKFANQVLDKYNRTPKYSSTKNKPHTTFNGHLKHSVTNPMAGTPKKAWVEDDLLVHGWKVLNKTEKFLRSNHMKNHYEVMDLTAEDIKKNMIQQNAEFKTPVTKVPFHRLSLAHGGSITSDTDSDEPTHDGPSMSSDFGLDQLLEKISSANKSSLGHHHRHQRSSQERIRPLRAAASFERGLNKITDPLSTYSSGYNTVSPTAPLRLEHLNTRSVPDLGPETVNRIASVNQYLQQKWTNYFGELSVPLGGKAGWPAQIIGQSTLLVNKNPTANFLPSNNRASLSPGQRSSFVRDGDAGNAHIQKEDRNISQKIDDLRVWLEKAQTTSDAIPDK
ncbi:uncharacterized protein [Panulirus ornatus]|uniref:uncharacterized protein n=1 Tax=Panulirus ornatus TaxID=150431 RepID=UPI003A83B6C8